jgi:photosystem II stability/assembly factor-like uncharacterized protein
MLVTRDGGTTWKVPSFPIPSSTGCPCYFQMPNFADSSHGMLVVSGQNGLVGTTLLLTTSDGGTTWRESKRPGTGYVLLLDFLSANDVFALVTPPGWNKGSNVGFELYRSPDGGGTWTLISPAVPATWPPGFLEFVDLNHGFEANVNGATELLITADGGNRSRRRSSGGGSLMWPMGNLLAGAGLSGGRPRTGCGLLLIAVAFVIAIIIAVTR